MMFFLVEFLIESLLLLTLTHVASGHIIAGGLLTQSHVTTSTCYDHRHVWHLANANMMGQPVDHPHLTDCKETDILWGSLETMSIPGLLPQRVLHVTEHGVDWVRDVGRNEYTNICRAFGHSREHCRLEWLDGTAKLETWCIVNRKIRDDASGVIEQREAVEGGNAVKYKHVKTTELSGVDSFLFGQVHLESYDTHKHLTFSKWHRITEEHRSCLIEFGYKM
jgi:hypothetical protein